MINFKKIQWGILASVLMVLPACGNDDDDNQPINGGGNPTAQKLQSTSAFGMTLTSYKYDNQGRLTHFQMNDADEDFMDPYMTIDISYSPLKMKISYPQDGEESVWTNIVTNSAGYLTSAKVTEKYYGETETWSITASYDSSNHLTSFSTSGSDPDHTTLKWDGHKLVSYNSIDEDGYSFTDKYTYSNTENQVGNVSTAWGAMSMFWISGLFGEVPGYLPSQVWTSDLNNDVDILNLAYKLDNNGFIAKEQITSYGDDNFDSFTYVVDYNYIGGRASDSDEMMSKGESSVKFKKPHKMFGLFHRR